MENIVLNASNSRDDEVGYVCLKNQGGFVVELDFAYLNNKNDKIRVSGSGKNITLGKSETVDPGIYGVPDGAHFTVHADVKLGKDNDDSIWLVYKKNTNKVAKYNISGTTLNNELGLVSIYDM